MKVFINNFNLLTYPKAMAEFLADVGCDVIFVDNKSNYPPLLEWYDKCPYKVIFLNYNYRDGERKHKSHIRHSVWDSGVAGECGDRFYMVTDPDLDMSITPVDFVDKLIEGLAKYDVFKAGLSIKIDELIGNKYAKKAYAHEATFYARKKYEDGWYLADTSTTIALYDHEKCDRTFHDAVRSPIPYQMRHIPYHLTKDTLTDEYKNYLATSKWRGWGTLIESLT